jgi:hypothetical protein
MTHRPKSARKPASKPASKTANPHHAHMRRATVTRTRSADENPYVVVRNSRIHGKGVYAARRIRKGTRIIEYVGDRISHDEADARYDARPDDGHTFLFVVDDALCIDAGIGGNAARFINHKCDANCETIIEDRRVFIEAIRTIPAGEELGYDYQLTWESTDDPEELALYRCLCGAAGCRGTMLDRVPLDEKRRRERARRKARKGSETGQGRTVAKQGRRGTGRTG